MKRRPGPGRPTAEDAAELPDRLLDAAFVLFTEHGFADATMEQIARRAGASTKTLYTRFANKSEILEAVIRRNVERTVATHVATFGREPRRMAPRDFLLRLGLQIADAADDETAGLVRLTFAEAHRFPVLRRLYREVTQRAIDVISRALNQWREDGLVAFEGDADLLSRLCFGMMTDGPRIRSVIGDPMSRAEVQRHVNAAVDLFLRGVSGEGAAASG